MRAEFIRIYKIVHTWTGIVAGIALFIAFYAGALTVFKEPLARWASPPGGTSAAAVPLADTPALIAQVLATDPQAAEDFVLYLKEAEHLPARMGWKVRDEGADDHDELSPRHFIATLQTDGTASVHEVRPSKLAEFIDVLHRVVGLPIDSDANRWIMGLIAVLYGVALVSGVIVLLPSLVKDLFALRVGKNLKRMWLDAHNVVGLFSLPFHLVMAITAVGFAFHDDIYALQNAMIHRGGLAGTFAPRIGTPAASAARDPAAMLPPAELLRRAQALSPAFEAVSLQYTQVTGPRAAVRIWGHDANALSLRTLGGFVALDPYSGRVISTDFLPGRQDAAHTVITSLFALHLATFGGAPVKWMYFLLGLAGAWLFYSGNLLWVETRRRRASSDGSGPPVQRRDALMMAALTVGVCLGCICGISLTIVAGKWLHGHVDDLTAWHRYIYYATFFAAIAWAFACGAGRAATHLSWLAAVFTVAIPITTLLAWLVPALGLWAYASPATLAVDATALVAAACFALMAASTARRVRHGPVDSVWSDGTASANARSAGPHAISPRAGSRTPS